MAGAAALLFSWLRGAVNTVQTVEATLEAVFVGFGVKGSGFRVQVSGFIAIAEGLEGLGFRV